MRLWKLNIKTASAPGKNPKQFCLENSIMGVGWPISDSTEGASQQTFLKAANETYGTKKNHVPPGLRAMVEEVAIDDLVWTRDGSNIYYMGRVLSGWRYVVGAEPSKDWEGNNIHNIREVEWHKIGTAEAVPWGIRKQFSRGTLGGINKDGRAMLEFSKRLYHRLPSTAKHPGAPNYSTEESSDKSFFALIGPDQCEDVVALYLQHIHGYLLYPSTSKKTTKTYEYVLVHPGDGHRALVQVKSGVAALNREVFQRLVETETTQPATKIYLFSTDDRYAGIEDPRIECLSSKELERFVHDNTNLMPRSVSIWLHR